MGPDGIGVGNAGPSCHALSNDSRLEHACAKRFGGCGHKGNDFDVGPSLELVSLPVRLHRD